MSGVTSDLASDSGQEKRTKEKPSSQTARLHAPASTDHPPTRGGSAHDAVQRAARVYATGAIRAAMIDPASEDAKTDPPARLDNGR